MSAPGEETGQVGCAGEVGRLAPSPTGGLHVGHSRTFLVAWLMARRAGGRVVFRVEDIDASRVRPGMAEQAMADLRWLGIDWDEGPDVGGPHGPYLQSERFDRFEAALDLLKRAELVYPCTCSRSEIRRAASAPHLGEEGPVYPGTCAERSAGDARLIRDRPFAWRFRAGEEPVAWDDLFRGRLEMVPSAIEGDFVVGRSDGSPSYQLAVVVDDAAMGVTQVIRGDDLISSTPRQLLLYRALELVPPRFGHVPLVLGPDGRRLAKRDESIKLSTLREGGMDPRRLVGWIGETLGMGSGEPASPSEYLRRFEPDLVPEGPVAFDRSAIEQ
ncbi:tRNA glutamyl-Q(34) synthetase GluQRS [Tautonia sociabilis]|uniref:Glutamyl-Q tRNA(Asp) synthetase n=1 Tax=Tautonia sociabilis TaxID=2080755 RepID=A0A432MS40_9BACT|nr:tRNA glutamyl-Q(34) synthetase GluQRS [Tautonia sociabilis]RUL89795.1 tRNA glutamyl-Q(34) synthetase GluQRS [Tautonia sociabilis]